MSLKALVEVLIHVDSFRNIDLYYQGLYYAKIKMYYRKPKPEDFEDPASSNAAEED
jgi:hypothetical protein